MPERWTHTPGDGLDMPITPVIAPRPAWHEDERRLWKRRLLTMDIGATCWFPGGITVKRAEWSYLLHRDGVKLNITDLIGHEANTARRIEKIMDWIIAQQPLGLGSGANNMAAQSGLTAGQMVILSELQTNGAMRYSEFDNRDDVGVLVERGLVREVGGARVALTKTGAEQADALKHSAKPAALPPTHGNGTIIVPLSDTALEALLTIHGDEVVRGRGMHVVLEKLRDHDLIEMGATQWKATARGRERLIAEGLLDANALPAGNVEPTAKKADVVATNVRAASEQEAAPISAPSVASVTVGDVYAVEQDTAPEPEAVSVDQPDLLAQAQDDQDVPASIDLSAVQRDDCADCPNRRFIDFLLDQIPQSRAVYERFTGYQAAQQTLLTAQDALSTATDELRRGQ